MAARAQAWGRANHAATTVSGLAWRAEVARGVREATGAAFASVLTCAPGRWSALQQDTYPGDYAPCIVRVEQEYIARIDRSGEGWRSAVSRFGTVYAPLDTARKRELADEMREQIWRPAGIDGYVVGFLLDDVRRLLGMIIIGSEHPSRVLLRDHGAELAGLCGRAAGTLGAALALASACGARFPPDELDLEALTAREREVAELAASGFSTVNIGAKLGISAQTVAVHMRHIHHKLGVHGRAELTRRLLGVR